MYELPGTQSRERTLIDLSCSVRSWRSAIFISGLYIGRRGGIKLRYEFPAAKWSMSSARSAATLHQHHRWLKIAQRRVIK